MTDDIVERLRQLADDADGYYPALLAHEAADTISRLRSRVEELPAKVASGLGEHYAAAMHDHEIADPTDVGFNGIPIKVWRAAYAEGIKDVGGTIMRHLELDEAAQKAFQQKGLAVYKDQRNALK